MGRLAKNRNVGVAVTFSLLSALIAVPALGTLMRASHLRDKTVTQAKEPLEKTIGAALSQGVDTIFDKTTLGTSCMIAGLVMATVFAAVSATQVVEGGKFCETCELTMKRWSLKSISLGGVKSLLRALADNNLHSAIKICTIAEGSDCALTLFSCPRCGNGYLEASMTFRGEWIDERKGQQTLVRDWLVGSHELKTTDAEALWPQVEKAKSKGTSAESADFDHRPPWSIAATDTARFVLWSWIYPILALALAVLAGAAIVYRWQ
jgi:hypothetical protein